MEGLARGPEGLKPEVVAFMNLISRQVATLLVGRAGYDKEATKKAFIDRLR